MIDSATILLVLIAAIILFGPNKIPELARSIGKAMGEFKRAQSEGDLRSKQLFPSPELKPSNVDKDTKIIKLAIDIGIDIRDKTSEQLIEEIRLRMTERK